MRLYTGRMNGNPAEPARTIMQIGTSYFVSIDKAAMYYRDYEGSDGYATANRKLSTGEIHIGKPPIKENERLLTIDKNTRYAIEWDEPKVVKVYVRGGCVQNVDCPDGVTVKVYDYDSQDYDKGISDNEGTPDRDDEGEPCSVAVYP